MSSLFSNQRILSESDEDDTALSECSEESDDRQQLPVHQLFSQRSLLASFDVGPRCHFPVADAQVAVGGETVIFMTPPVYPC